MFTRLSNSWELVKASAAVLKADKELLIFPIVSAILSILVMATFAIPTFLAGIVDFAATQGEIPVAGWVICFLFYVAQYFVIIFSNTALVGAALIRLSGGDPTVGDGFRIAFDRIGSIFGYALVSATVGVILRTLAQRGGAIGRIVSSLFGLAWSLATYLVVPVMVVENVGPIEAIKRSANHLKKTWGEQIVGNIGIGTVFGLVMFFVILLFVLAIMLVAPTKSVVLIAGVVIVFVLTLIVLGLVSSTLGGIYTAAVYRYAAEGEASGFFSRELVTHAFRAK